MTSYLTNVALGAAAPMVSKDKGDISNRFNCSIAQLGNNAKTLLADTVVIGSAAGATKLALKNGKYGAISKTGAKVLDFDYELA